MSGEPPMQHYIVPFRQDKVVLVMQRVRHGASQTEQTVSPGRDVGAVLNVIWRPEFCRFGIITFVEKRIECLENQFFVFFT